MEMIAEAAGLKKPTLYHYVKGKDEILFLMQRAVIVGVREGIEARIARGEGPLELLQGVYEDIFRQCRVALNWGHPQSVWRNGSILARNSSGPALPYMARLSVFNRLI